MKKIVILTGAGISKESGISTFRDSDGLWNNHSIDDVATPKGWLMNQELVLQFYNERRRQLKDVEPNEAHKQLVRLEEKFDVHIVTQNVDNLHERAGSKNVLHLHGELTKAKSSGNDDYVRDIGYEDIKIGDVCDQEFQMRPQVVWFNESVPNIIPAEALAMKADIFIVIGTSLQVYPAAGLHNLTSWGTPIYLVDPNDMTIFSKGKYVTVIKKPATEGVTELVNTLLGVEAKEEILPLKLIAVDKLKQGDVFLWKSEMTGKFEIHTFHSDAGYGVKTFTDYNEKDGSSLLVNYSGVCGVLVCKD